SSHFRRVRRTDPHIRPRGVAAKGGSRFAATHRARRPGLRGSEITPSDWLPLACRSKALVRSWRSPRSHATRNLSGGQRLGGVERPKLFRPAIAESDRGRVVGPHATLANASRIGAVL